MGKKGGEETLKGEACPPPKKKFKKKIAHIYSWYDGRCSNAS